MTTNRIRFSDSFLPSELLRRWTAAVALFFSFCAFAGSTPPPTSGVFFTLRVRKLDSAWKILRESGFADRLERSRFVRRFGLLNGIRIVTRKVRNAGNFFGVDILASLREAAAGELFFAGALENGSQRFFLDLTTVRPAGFPLLLERLAARDPAVSLTGKKTVAGRQVERVRWKKRSLFVIAEPRRLLVTDSTALLETALAGGLAPPWPREPDLFLTCSLVPSLLPENRGAGPHRSPVERIEAAVSLDRAGAHLVGRLRGTPERFLVPFLKLEGRSAQWPDVFPGDRLGSLRVRADLVGLWKLFVSMVPRSERASLRREIEGFEKVFLRGKKLESVLRGLGPEAVLVVTDLRDSPIPAAFSLLCRIRSEEARSSLNSLGSILYGLALLSDSKAEKEVTDAVTRYQATLDGVRVGFGISDRGFFLTSDGSLSQKLASALGGPAAGEASAGGKEFLLLRVDAQRLAEWLDDHRESLLRDAFGRKRFRRTVEMETASDICRLFRRIEGAASVEDRGGEKAVRIDFRLLFAAP